MGASSSITRSSLLLLKHISSITTSNNAETIMTNTSSKTKKTKMTKTETLKIIVRSESFRNSFLNFMEVKKGKGVHIKCFQRLEEMRKDFVLEARKIEEQEVFSVDTVATASSVNNNNNNNTNVSNHHLLLTDVNCSYDELAVVNKGLSLLHEISSQPSRYAFSREWIQRIIVAQEAILTNLFDDFEEYLESEDAIKVLNDHHHSALSCA